LARVCRLWDLPRSTLYCHRHRESIPTEPRPEARKRGPQGPCSDEELVGHIHRILTESPFDGEGYRKVWARLRYQGIREHFGGFDLGIAAGLSIRHDHGSADMSDDFQRELNFLGLTSLPSFVREPEEYNQQWLIERHGFRTPSQVRSEFGGRSKDWETDRPYRNV
jgi:hypothetical protein